DDPRPLRGGVDLGAVSRPSIRSSRNDHAGAALEGYTQVLELRNVVPLQMLARLGAQVDRRREDTPRLDLVLEVRDERGFQLEEKLPDPPAVRPRLKRDRHVGLANAGSRDETEGRLKPLAHLLEIQRHVPAIVRIIELEAARASATPGCPVVGREQKEVEGEILVAA